MKRLLLILGTLTLTAGCATGCAHQTALAPVLQATATGSTIVESSGGKQLGTPGAMLQQPLVVQVNDVQGNAVTGALVEFRAAEHVTFDPAASLTDSSGQVSTTVTLGGTSGRYELTAASTDKSGKQFDLNITELALGYQTQLGYELDQKYCARCHDQVSTPQRVSNYDNLAVKPPAFTDGDTLNKRSDSDLTAIISHGGPALNRSALMPPYGATLGKPDIQALIAYIRLVSSPPSRIAGLVYARR
jgi:mono/diheme cytochrome c family protein